MEPTESRQITALYWESHARLRKGPHMPEENDLNQVMADEPVPTAYANSMAMTITPFDVAFTFGLRSGSTVVPQHRVIMSLEHAMVMLMVGRRHLREHIKRTGTSITIPPEVMHELQLDEEEPLWS